MEKEILNGKITETENGIKIEINGEGAKKILEAYKKGELNKIWNKIQDCCLKSGCC